MARTRALAVEAFVLTEGLPGSRAADVVGRQLFRCATSAGANYRASRRARSRPEFIAKMGIVEEEADEAIYWIELLCETGLTRKAQVADLVDCATQIVAMAVASIKTARRNLKQEKGHPAG